MALHIPALRVHPEAMAYRASRHRRLKLALAHFECAAIDEWAMAQLEAMSRAAAADAVATAGFMYAHNLECSRVIQSLGAAASPYHEPLLRSITETTETGFRLIAAQWELAMNEYEEACAPLETLLRACMTGAHCPRGCVRHKCSPACDIAV